MPTLPVKIAIVGAAGRMGRLLCTLTADDPALALVEAVDSEAAPDVAGGVAVTPTLTDAADAVVEFALPAATPASVAHCVEHNLPLVIGTTGHDAAGLKVIEDAAAKIPICHAANYSLVVNVLMNLAGRAARMLGDAYDCEIAEIHHRFKKDAPSGTALTLARAVCEATGRDPDKTIRLERQGDAPREAGEITVQALRLGDVVGEHTVYFGTLGERLELRHVGASRESYAIGALRAARWLVTQDAGLYTMTDVLDLQ